MGCVKRSKRAFQVYRLSILSAQFSIYISTTASLGFSSNPCSLRIIERKRLNKKEERKIPSSRKDQISSLIRIRVNKTRRETTRLCPAYKFGLTNLGGVMTSKRGWKMERVERSFIASPHKSAR